MSVGHGPVTGESDIVSGLSDIFRTVFGRSIALRPDMTAADVAGWDSIAMVSLVVGIEERFSIMLRSREIERLDTVGGMIGLVGDKLGVRTGRSV